MKTWIFLTALLSVTQASAGHDKGNGGFAIQCMTEGTIRTEVLDLYEARWVRNLTMKTFTSQDPYEIATQVAHRLDARSPKRAARYVEGIAKFHDKASFVSNAQWTDVGDYGPIFIPHNCQVVPAAIQKRFSIEEEPTFFVQKEIWDQLPVVDQAALILHEIIYREFAHETSVLTRSFNGLLFSMEFDNYVSDAKFLDMLVKVGAPTYEYGSFEINIRQGYVANSEGMVRAFVIPGVYDEGATQIPYIYQRVEFYPNKKPKALRPDNLSMPYTVACFGTFDLLTEDRAPIRFHRNGRIQKTFFDTAKTVVDPVGCNGVRYQKNLEFPFGWLELDPNANLLGYRGIDAVTAAH